MRFRPIKPLLFGLCTLIGIGSCTAAGRKTEETNKKTNTEMNTDGKKLVVFFSIPEKTTM